MPERFDLLKMLREIEEDEEKQDNKAQKLSQDDIRKMLLERRKNKGEPSGQEP